MTVETVEVGLIAGVLVLEITAGSVLRALGYWEQGILCPRCGTVHQPPRSYRSPHQPKEDWQALDRQCRRPFRTVA